MFLNNFLSRLLPKVKADDDEEPELVDPLKILREKCKEEHAKHLADRYEECNNRVRSKKNTTESCKEELFDLLHAIDHCVAKDLFSKLK